MARSMDTELVQAVTEPNAAAGFSSCSHPYAQTRDKRYVWGRLQSVGTAIKGLVPSLRKSLIALAVT